MTYFLFLILVSSILNPSKVFAQTPTETAANNIQAIREAVQQKVKDKLKEITSPSQVKKSLIGTVIQIDSSSVTIEHKGSTQKLMIESDLTLVNSLGNKVTLDKIKIGQDIIAMGIDDASSSTFSLKRIVLIDLKKINFSRTIVVGKIVDISKTSSLLTLVSDRNKNDLYQIKTDTKTELVNKNKQKIKSSDISLGKRVIGILVPDEKMSKTYYANKLISLDLAPEASPTAKP